MIIKNFTKSSQHNHNCIECIGRYGKKNDLKTNTESVSYCYTKKNTKVMSTRKKETVKAVKWCEWQNILISESPFRIQEVKLLPTHWIKQNDNLKRIMNWGSRL